MKKVLTPIFLLFVLIYQGHSQNIIHFFKNVPDSSIMNYTKLDRSKIYEHYKKYQAKKTDDRLTNEIDASFSKLDIRNGYIEITGFFEGEFQMCYWNMKNGHKLIACY
ncbi:MAG: hypothetical protein N4A49_09680 [Marinifilaceae bacterium]|jgi:hypothetical protein|nr:hypothetical protein [Marinifilaceae bacterium]